jgi:hypothetical protein
MVARGLELGENRIIAGMHSPLDVISGRVQAQAIVAANLLDPVTAATKAAAVTQAHATLMAKTGTTADTFYDYAHSGTSANDRFSDYASTKAAYIRRLTFGFAQTAPPMRRPSCPRARKCCWKPVCPTCPTHSAAWC